MSTYEILDSGRLAKRIIWKLKSATVSALVMSMNIDKSVLIIISAFMVRTVGNPSRVDKTNSAGQLLTSWGSLSSDESAKPAQGFNLRSE